MPKRLGWLLLIFLIAASLRLAGLYNIPPGLTHDEADHGLDAWGVVNGDRPIYFTVGFGREPLYDYATAAVMAVIGPTFLAGRLTSAFFSLILIAGTYVWTRSALNRRVALLTAASLAVSFWAVMTGRQALRSITLPALLVLVAYFYWRAVYSSPGVPKISKDHRQWFAAGNFLLSGFLLGATFYTYIPARIMWLLFPAFLLFLLLFDRKRFRRVWPGTTLMLVVAALVALPLIIFLAANPGAEERLGQLNTPLVEAFRGNLTPLASNTIAGLKLLFLEGDGRYRYNIPGRPFLSPIMALLFLVGLGLAFWRIWKGIRHKQQINQASALFFLLLWIGLGLAPALVTGPDLSTTRIIGLLPVLYIPPALVLSSTFEIKLFSKKIGPILSAFVLFTLLAQTVVSYFFVWARAPEVRVQYETSLVSTVRYLNGQQKGAVAISTTTPGRYHSPAVAFLNLVDREKNLRWFNGQHSLLVPDDQNGSLVLTGFAPLTPYLSLYLSGQPVTTVPVPDTDLDRPIEVYELDGPAHFSRWESLFSRSLGIAGGVDLPLTFGEVVDLAGFDLQTPVVTPGEQVRLATLWRARRPMDDAVLFTHLLDREGQIIAQDDRLDAPSHSWIEGDYFIQLHQFRVPETTPDGKYTLIVGVYERQGTERLPVSANGVPIGDYVRLPALTVES